MHQTGQEKDFNSQTMDDSCGVQEYLSGIQEASTETRKLNGLKR